MSRHRSGPPRRGRWLLLGVLGLAVVLAVTAAVTGWRPGAPGGTAAAGDPAAGSTAAGSADTAPLASATPSPAPVPTTPPVPTFDAQRFSTSDPASPWVVVNKTRPLTPLEYAPADLVPVGNGETLAAPAAAALDQLVTAAAAQGLTVSPLSGYRSYDYQQGVHASAVSRLGRVAADAASARAGYSEHQTGLGVDVGGGGCDIEQCFAGTPEGTWVAAECWRYGWIVRYTAPEQQVTGYKGEPWHLRYVGVELSTEMRARGVATLEQFFGLPAAPDYLD